MTSISSQINPYTHRNDRGATAKLMRTGTLTILQFHDVDADAQDGQSLSIRRFSRLMDRLQEVLQFLPLRDALTLLREGRLPAGAACLTFDDGYANWLEVVAPDLRRRGVHATFFVSSGHLHGVPLWHQRVERSILEMQRQGGDWIDRLPFELRGIGHTLISCTSEKVIPNIQEVCKYLPLARREEVLVELERLAGDEQAARPFQPFLESSVRRLHELGFEIGAHTVNHPILALESNQVVADELLRSRLSLERIIGHPVTMLAYPNGRPLRDFCDKHIQLARDAGFQAAFTTAPGAADSATDIMQIPRFAPWRQGNLALRLDLIRNSWRRCLSTHALHKRPRHRVMLVENGAGFGGAVVAAGSLLSNLDPAQVEMHLVTNTSFSAQPYPSVRSVHYRNGRRFNFRAAAQFLEVSVPWPLSRVGTLGLSLLDEIFNRFPYLLGLMATAIRVRPDIIHGNNGPTSNREALWVARLLRKTYVQHLRGPHSGNSSSVKELQQASIVIPVSRWLAQRVLREPIDPSRVRQVYDGMRLAPESKTGSKRNIRRLYNLAPEATLVAMVGMLVKWKGQSDFIEACKRLSLDEPDLRFLVVGDEPTFGDPGFRFSLEEAAGDLVSRGVLRFTGKLEDLPQVMDQFDVVVSASVEPEPLGLVMLEAMAAGCEFVGPAHGGAEEVVKAVGYGHLFPPRSIEGMVAAIKNALNSVRSDAHAGAQNHSQPRMAARQLVENAFSEARCASETLLAYEAARPGGW